MGNISFQSGNKSHITGNSYNDTVIAFMVTDIGYPFGKHNIMYTFTESLCFTCEINVTLCVSYTQKIN